MTIQTTQASEATQAVASLAEAAVAASQEIQPGATVTMALNRWVWGKYFNGVIKVISCSFELVVKLPLFPVVALRYHIRTPGCSGTPFFFFLSVAARISKTNTMMQPETNIMASNRGMIGWMVRVRKAERWHKAFAVRSSPQYLDFWFPVTSGRASAI